MPLSLDITDAQDGVGNSTPFCELLLTDGKTHALIDVADLHPICFWKWRPRRVEGQVYAASGHLGGNFAMHRVVMKAPPGTIVDHINGNGLDNRRSNLRFATNQENQRNARKRGDGTTPFKGVRRKSGGFEANIRTAAGKKYLGRFDSAERAAVAYDDAAREHFGSFASLNFPRTGERSALPSC